jgi:hypothetical protein
VAGVDAAGRGDAAPAGIVGFSFGPDWSFGMERPGFGASTRLPGRGFAEHADDLAAVLDELRLDAVHVTGASGASAHELCFAGRPIPAGYGR